MTVSFYVHGHDTDEKQPSSIKFGGYDPANIADQGRTLSVIRTIDTKSWDLRAEDYTVGEQKGTLDGVRLRLDPGLPYLYVPKEIFDQFADVVKQKTKIDACKNDNGSTNAKVCKFDQSCSDVRSTFGESAFEMAFTLQRDTLGGRAQEKYTYSFQLFHGTVFGDSEKTCYLPIFDHGLTGEQDKKTVIVGNNLMQGHYVVYDMSPLEAG